MNGQRGPSFRDIDRIIDTLRIDKVIQEPMFDGWQSDDGIGEEDPATRSRILLVTEQQAELVKQLRQLGTIVITTDNVPYAFELIEEGIEPDVLLIDESAITERDRLIIQQRSHWECCSGLRIIFLSSLQI